MTRCPVPGCDREAPKRGVFCVEHYFLLPRAYTGLIFRVKFAAERETDAETKAHLQTQLQGYIRSAIGHLPATGPGGANAA